MIEKLKSILLYAGVSREDYRKVKADIDESNRRNLLVFSVIIAVAMMAEFFLTFVNWSATQSRMAYLWTSLGSAALAALAATVAKKYTRLIIPLMYLLISILLGFGIALGTYFTPNQLTVSYFILLFAAPLFFTDRPINMILELLASLIIYAIAAAATQTPEYQSMNQTNLVSYGLISLIVCAYLMNIKVERYTNEREKKYLSECDQLTGLLNRRSYEQHLQALRDSGRYTDAVICAFDVNGLKTVNDNLGHRAGDELLIGAADCLNAVFGQYGACYRIGGDEYMAILEGTGPSDEELISMLASRTRSWKGMLVSGLSISVGITHHAPGLKLEDMVNEADKRMYEDKARYYEQNGIKRR